MQRKIPFVIAALSFAASFGLVAPNTAFASPSSARVASACASMGLNPSEAPFAFCEMSLQDSAASITHTRVVAIARHACRGHGLRAGTAAFANCVLDSEDGIAADRGSVPAAQQPVASYAYESYQRGDLATSVRRACANIGLAPGAPGYSSCVGDLNATIDDSNMAGSD